MVLLGFGFFMLFSSMVGVMQVGIVALLFCFHSWLFVGLLWWVCLMVRYGGVVVLGFCVFLNGINVILCCSFGHCIYTTLESGMLGHRMEEEKLKSVCGRSVRCSGDLVVHFRFVKSFIVFIFKIHI